MIRHVHVGLVAAFCTLLELLIAWIPVKIIAAHFEDRSPLASTILHVL